MTVEEVEEVLRDPDSERPPDRVRGTSTGKYIAVVYEEVLDDPLTVYPITAFIAPPPGG